MSEQKMYTIIEVEQKIQKEMNDPTWKVIDEITMEVSGKDQADETIHVLQLENEAGHVKFERVYPQKDEK